jgi:hypothetical protein
MSSIQQWAREYRNMGFAVCQIKPGDKRPTYKAWNQYSLEPESFSDGDNIGLQAGAISRNLVCVDLDHADVLSKADRYLPRTGMVEGRAGKPRSHHWFVVKDIPPDLAARPGIAGGLGGPRTRRFRRPDKQSLVDFLGTGSQAVVPASVWTSRDGSKRELREWQEFNSPAEVDCSELFDAVCTLATAAGWSNKAKVSPGKARGKLRKDAPSSLPMPTCEAARQARAYLAKVAPAIEGQGGDQQTFTAACSLVLGFGLSPEDALPLMLEYNQRCTPPWTVEELWHKLTKANELECDDRGWRVRKRSVSVVVNLLPDQPVYVGVDCAAEGRSYIDLAPSLYAGMVKDGTQWELSPELAAVAWQGRDVILAPTSTITTNVRETWGEFFLARLLREEGAAVKSLRLPPLNGRRRTLSIADEQGWAVIDPPFYAWDAAAAAEMASQEALRLDSYRRALPRQKPSPKLERAITFVCELGIGRVTKDVLKHAKRKGITEATLRRAIFYQSRSPPKALPSSPLCIVYPPICKSKDEPISCNGNDFRTFPDKCVA